MPKSKHEIPGRVRATYEFIKANRDTYRETGFHELAAGLFMGGYDLRKA